jgi:6,7-dimethyl-8-ribityllumazine synthase
MKFAIVVAEFNKPLVDAMVAAAREEATSLDIEIMREVRVPGCYETPLIVSQLLPRKKIDAVVVLGYIERGETLHGEVMGNVVHKALVDLEITHGKPIGLGIIGPGATAQQADSRKDGYARAAVRAALANLKALAALDEPRKK